MKAISSLGCPLDVVGAILKFEPSINQADSNGRTALHLACLAGRLDVVQLLHEVEGIDVNCRTKGGETPLMKAVQSGNLYLVGECLNNNYNPFLENSLR